MGIVNLRNRKGIEATLSWARDIIIFMVILLSVWFVASGGSLSGLKAMNAVRGVGAAFDVLALSPNEITIRNTCPEHHIFRLESSPDYGGDIVLNVNVIGVLGENSWDYYFLREKNAIISHNEVDCSRWSYVYVSKKIQSGSVIIEMRGGSY